MKNETSGMNNHMKIYKNHPNNAYKGDNQTITSFCQSVTGEFRDVCSKWKFEQDAISKALVMMTIKDELPFKFVENEDFREFMYTACPQFVVPSRRTIARDCYNLYSEEKK